MFSADSLRAAAANTSWQSNAPSSLHRPSWLDEPAPTSPNNNNNGPSLKALERQQRRRASRGHEQPSAASSIFDDAPSRSYADIPSRRSHEQQRAAAAPLRNLPYDARRIPQQQQQQQQHNGGDRVFDEESSSPGPLWSRAALEARVATLEGMLATMDSLSVVRSSDRELSEHLQVTVRANRELRAELEVAKASIARLEREKEQLLDKLAQDKNALDAVLRDTQAAKESLQTSFTAMVEERKHMEARIARLEADNQAMRRQKEQAVYDPVVVKSNLDDVQAINEALKESLRLMRARTTTP